MFFKAKRFYLLVFIALILLPHEALPAVNYDDFEIITERSVSATLKADDQALNISQDGHLTLNNPTKLGKSNYATIKAYSKGLVGLTVEIDADGDNGIYSTRGALKFTNAELLDFNLVSGLVSAGEMEGNVLDLLNAQGDNNINIRDLGRVINNSTSGAHTINYVGTQDSSLTISLEGSASNRGQLSSSSLGSDSKVVYFDDVGAAITIENDGGLVSANDADNVAIEVINSGLITVTNSGTNNVGSIVGQIINSGDGEFRLTNNVNSTIEGDIFLGSHTDSFVEINGGSVVGDLTFGDAEQRLSLLNSAQFEGAVKGQGSIILDGQDSYLTLRSSTLDASVDGASTSESSAGNIIISEDQNVITNANIGATKALSLILLKSGSSLDLATNNNSLLSAVELNQNSLITIGSEVVTGSISSAVVDERLGSVVFSENNSLDGSVTDIDFMSISAGKTLEFGAYDISVNDVEIGDGAVVNAAGGDLSASFSLGTAAILNLGESSTISGSVSGSLDNRGVLNLSGRDISVDFGVGSVNSLSQVNLYAGSSAGFNSDIAANNVNIMGQATFGNSSGNTITGNITTSNGGSLDIGSATHQINGDLTLASGSSLLTSINSSNAVGNINVAGVATVSDNISLVLDLANSDLITRESSYKIISGGDGSSISQIAHDNILINGSTHEFFNNLSFSTEVSNNELFINFTARDLVLGTTSSQRGLYGELQTIDRASTSGSLLSVLQEIDSSTSNAAASETLESLKPQDDGSLSRVPVTSARNSLSLSSKRLSLQRRGYSSGDGSLKRSLWSQTFGSKISQASNSFSQGYEASSYGFAFGDDHEVKEDVIVGLSVSYSNSTIKSIDQLKRTDIDTYQINLYGSEVFEDFFIDGMVGFAYSQYHSHRQIPSVSVAALAKYSGQTYIAKVEVGDYYEMMNEITISPTVSITAARNKMNDYGEEGAGTLNLEVSNNDTSFFEARIGTEISKNFHISRNKKIRPHLALSFGYDFAGSKQKTSARFVGQSARFHASSAAMPQGSLRVGSGVGVFYRDAFTVDLEYALDHRVGYDAHSGSLKAKYEF
jgi:hypothetical protein